MTKTRTSRRTYSQLNDVWNALAPAADHGFVWRLVAEIEVDGGATDERAVCKAIVGRLYDGLAYGNWPSR